MITRFTVSTLLALLLVGLHGCGQKGPLTPPPPDTTQSEPAATDDKGENDEQD